MFPWLAELLFTKVKTTIVNLNPSKIMVVIYEDNHIIAVNKTCSGNCTGDKTVIFRFRKQSNNISKKKYNKTGNVFVVLHTVWTDR